MRYYFFALFLSISLISCKNTECKKLKPYTDKVAVALASPSVLDCSGVDAMKKDIIDLCQEKGLCKATEVAGPISTVVCPIVVPYIMSFGLSKLPPAWNCKAESSEALIIAACQSIPY